MASIDVGMRGSNNVQDTRFKNKEAAFIKSTKFPKTFGDKVDLRKVNVSVLRPWIAKKVTELIKIEDDVVVDYVFEMLEDKERPIPDPRMMQNNLVGFMDKHAAAAFMDGLWGLLLSAQSTVGGVPAAFIEAKKAEIQSRADGGPEQMQDQMMARRAAAQDSFDHRRDGGNRPSGMAGLPPRPGPPINRQGGGPDRYGRSPPPPSRDQGWVPPRDRQRQDGPPRRPPGPYDDRNRDRGYEARRERERSPPAYRRRAPSPEPPRREAVQRRDRSVTPPIRERHDDRDTRNGHGERDERAERRSYEDEAPRRYRRDDRSPPRRRQQEPESPPPTSRRRHKDSVSPPAHRRSRPSPSPPHRARVPPSASPPLQRRDTKSSTRRQSRSRSRSPTITPPRRQYDRDDTPPRRQDSTPPRRRHQGEDRRSAPRKRDQHSESPPARRPARGQEDSPPRRPASATPEPEVVKKGRGRFTHEDEEEPASEPVPAKRDEKKRKLEGPLSKSKWAQE